MILDEFSVDSGRILIMGFGDLGKKVANQLISQNAVSAIHVVGRSADRIEKDSNLLRLTAFNLGWQGTVSWSECDVRETDKLTSIIDEFSPSIVINSSSLQSWRRLTELPANLFNALDSAQFGPWLSAHLPPCLSLMKAVSSSRHSPVTVNCAFPDAVNPVLAKIGLKPTIGAGNAANLVPALTFAIADELNVKPCEVEVKLVAQHYFSHRVPRYGDSGGARFDLAAYVYGERIDIENQRDAILEAVSKRYRRTGGLDGQRLTASSVLTVIKALLSDTPVAIHAAGPAGLPGGYPLWVNKSVIATRLDPRVSLIEAVKINESCQANDGILNIDSSGVAKIDEQLAKPIFDALEVNFGTVDPSTCWEAGLALNSAFEDYLESAIN